MIYLPKLTAPSLASVTIDTSGTITIPDDNCVPVNFSTHRLAVGFAESPFNEFGQFMAKQSAGLYRFTGSAEISNADSMFVRLVGPDGEFFDGMSSPDTQRSTRVATITQVFNLAVGDLVSFQVYQQSGANQNLYQSVTRNFLNVEFLG